MLALSAQSQIRSSVSSGNSLQSRLRVELKVIWRTFGPLFASVCSMSVFNTAALHQIFRERDIDSIFQMLLDREIDLLFQIKRPLKILHQGKDHLSKISKILRLT